jgi:MoxR-like ATPase
LWWAFSARSAARRGLSDAKLAEKELERLPDPSPRRGARAVVLIDEIDKADPDVPNDLLLPLGALRFAVSEVDSGPAVAADFAPLVFITTNEERDLPLAFVRRCVVLTLEDPDDDRMLDIAAAHFGKRATRKHLTEVLAAYKNVRDASEPESHEPNLAEYLDAVAAAVALDLYAESSDRWRDFVDLLLRKDTGGLSS